MAMAANMSMRDEGAAVESVANQPQTATNNATRIQRVSSEARLVPAGAIARMHTLILTGELDRGSAYALEAEIERVCGEGVIGITLDLRELAYIDSVGVAVIAFRCRLCQRRGYEFALIAGSRFIHRAFEQAGVANQLPFREDDLAAPRLSASALSDRLGRVAIIEH
jgi:anti-anti-sigma factor